MTRNVWACWCWCRRANEEEGWRKNRTDRELPDLKRQIRTSLKSITGEPCTDFISWQTCAAKRMQKDIDVQDWSLCLRNVHSEMRCRVCFGFCLLSESKSTWNTSLSMTFSLNNLSFIQQMLIYWRPIAPVYKIHLLGQMTINPALPGYSSSPRAAEYFFHKI